MKAVLYIIGIGKVGGSVGAGAETLFLPCTLDGIITRKNMGIPPPESLYSSLSDQRCEGIGIYNLMALSQTWKYLILKKQGRNSPFIAPFCI